LLEGLKIPPFGNLYKKIKIAQYRLHLTWKQEQKTSEICTDCTFQQTSEICTDCKFQQKSESCKNCKFQQDEEMRFAKRQVTYKKSPGFVPVIPLVPTKLTAEDKSAYITFTLEVSRGTGPGTPNYKKSVRTFEDGDPQQWMEVMTGLREIWFQNSVDDATDMSNTMVAMLKGDSLTAYEAAVEDLTVDPDDDRQVIPLTEDHVEKALRAVTETVFPFCALETQKQWMSRYMKKPYDMTAKTMTHAMSKTNNFLPYFPEAGMEDKYTETELIGILQYAVPEYYRTIFDLKDYIPTAESKIKFIAECERAERNKPPKSHKRDDDEDNHKSSK
jgi:hypothetical protein